MQRSTMTGRRPFPIPACWEGHSFLITHDGNSIQRATLPENWLIVKVNPLSVQAITRARQ